jgi:IS5 family transposase
MKPIKVDHSQTSLLEPRLSNILNPRHELLILAKAIDWQSLENEFTLLFVDGRKGGNEANPVRLMVGLLMLQHMFGLSDEEVVSHWLENGYWQFFCGYDYLQWSKPICPSSLSRWRSRLGESGMQKILSATIVTAISTKAVEKKSLEQVIVDSTVMPKNICYPTDGRLMNKARERLVKLAKKHGLSLRQNYNRKSVYALRKLSSYAHARQMKRAKKEQKKVKTYLGRVLRDISRQIVNNDELKNTFKEMFNIANKLLIQERDAKNKIYSVHAPEVECIAKGKVHKKYEYGCKDSLVLTHKEGLCISSQALHGNPYDGHCLNNALSNAEKISGIKVKKVFVDKGYKGHKVEGTEVYISGQKAGITKLLKKQLKRRAAIEPHIGHMKNKGKLDRNFLKGVIGDKINAILVAIGHNLRLILRKVRYFCTKLWLLEIVVDFILENLFFARKIKIA